MIIKLEDLDGPKFGWAVKVNFKKEEPCNPGSTCLNTFQNNLVNHYSRSFHPTSILVAMSRQTGESFKSAAPLDCRIQFIC